MFTPRLVLLGLSTVAIAATTTRSCSPLPSQTNGLIPPWPNKKYTRLCLEPDSRAESSVELNTTYPDGCKVVYAFQNYTAQEILDAATYDIIAGQPDHLQIAGIWFEYTKANLDKTAERVTVFDLTFLDNLDGTTDGAGNGGCDGVFGKECTDGLKIALQESLWQSTKPHGRKSTAQVDLFKAYQSIAWKNLSCPESLGGPGFYSAKTIAFESEAKPQESFIYPGENLNQNYVYPPGNSTWAYWTYAHQNTFEKERTKTMFGILVQSPYLDELTHFQDVPEEKWFVKENITVDLVCIKHDKSTGSGNGPNSKSNNTSTDGDKNSLAPFTVPLIANQLLFAFVIIVVISGSMV